MKKLYLFNIFDWSDSDYFASLDGSNLSDWNPKDVYTLEYVDENQFIFFFRSTYLILFNSVKVFNTLQDLNNYFLPLVYSGSLTEQNYTVGTIKQLLKRKGRAF